MDREVPLDRLVGLSNDQTSLASSQVTERRTQYGANAILEEASSNWYNIIRNTIQDPMIWFLVGTAALFLWLGEYTEAAVLAAALAPIIGMDAYLHRRTQASTEGLLARLATQTSVIRNDEEQCISSDELVPGDLVIVRPGEYFPADGLIVSGAGLQAEESSLTGEALPVRKLSFGWPAEAPKALMADNQYWGMAGTRLLTGTARIRVAFTGAETLYGEIVRLSRLSQRERTPLQEAISRLVQLLLVVALMFCAALAVIRYVQGYGIVDAVLSAVTLAIAALPEEFPVVLTFFLGLGVFRLAQRQALVRRAVVVENIGRVSCICCDKTGTLTEGQLTLDHSLPVEGLKVDHLLAIAATASRRETSDPLDLVLLQSARALDGEFEKVFPFTEDRLREVSVRRVAAGHWDFAMKGAPETVLAMSNLSEAQGAHWKARVNKLASTGHKVIGVASLGINHWNGEEPQSGFEFAGLLAFSDPVRPGVADAVDRAQKAGIRVIMITGDHAQTAEAIARDIGIGTTEPRAIDGSELKAALERDPHGIGFDVVSRCTPAQKLLLVQALHNRGEIVAVTGDGVNDAPALRGADVGIAMGLRGTRSAREVASIVLLDDDFSTIVRAVSEGRQLFANLKSSFAYLLMLHVPLVTTAALVPLLGYPLLYLPIHIVWLELIIHPTAMLAFQNRAPTDVLLPVEHHKRVRFFSSSEWISIASVGLVTSCIVLGSYLLSLGTEPDILHARAMAIAALVTAGSAITLGLTRLHSPVALIATIAPLASAVLAIQIEPLARILHLSPLQPDDWLIITLSGILTGAGAAFVRPR